MKTQKNHRTGGKEIAGLLDVVDLRKAALVLRAVNHKLRQRIIELVLDQKSMTVTDIYIKLRLQQSVASQHLAILRKVGVVTTDRQGKHIYYSVDQKRLQNIKTFIEHLVI